MSRDYTQEENTSQADQENNFQINSFNIRLNKKTPEINRGFRFLCISRKRSL